MLFLYFNDCKILRFDDSFIAVARKKKSLFCANPSPALPLKMEGSQTTALDFANLMFVIWLSFFKRGDDMSSIDK
jgi:hypothetical protein